MGGFLNSCRIATDPVNRIGLIGNYDWQYLCKCILIDKNRDPFLLVNIRFCFVLTIYMLQELFPCLYYRQSQKFFLLLFYLGIQYNSSPAGQERRNEMNHCIISIFEYIRRPMERLQSFMQKKIGEYDDGFGKWETHQVCFRELVIEKTVYESRRSWYAFRS